jgi:hypothetical protein
MTRSLAFALLLLLTAPAGAQEQRDPAPWRPLSGADAGAVGSCHRLDDDETVACLLVRCDARRGLELVYRHGDPPGERAHPTRFRIEIGRYRTEVTFTRLSQAEHVLPLAERGPLLDAMARPGREGSFGLFAPPGQGFSYSTAFELTRAGEMIARVRRSCPRG